MMCGNEGLLRFSVSVWSFCRSISKMSAIFGFVFIILCWSFNIMSLFPVWPPEKDRNRLWISLVRKFQAVVFTDWHNSSLGWSLWRLLQNIHKPSHSLLELTWFLWKVGMFVESFCTTKIQIYFPSLLR